MNKDTAIRYVGAVVVVTYIIVATVKGESLLDIAVAYGVLLLIIAGWYVIDKQKGR